MTIFNHSIILLHFQMEHQENIAKTFKTPKLPNDVTNIIISSN